MRGSKLLRTAAAVVLGEMIASTPTMSRASNRKRTAVVKHMLYDTNDVRWFKPAELVTKMGLRGHIKEPIGTHGLFKCLFSTPITQNDTIMLILYKRVYPKFPEGGVVTVR